MNTLGPFVTGPKSWPAAPHRASAGFWSLGDGALGLPGALNVSAVSNDIPAEGWSGWRHQFARAAAVVRSDELAAAWQALATTDWSAAQPVDWFMPTDELSTKARAWLGDAGSKRFDAFREYVSGWYFGGGSELDPGSVALLEKLAARLPSLASREPSLFLGVDGELQLQWEDRSGGAIEVRLSPYRLSYYIEPTEAEVALSSSEFECLVEAIADR